MMKFLHLSDLHFHMNGNKNRKINNTLNTVKEQYPNHYIIITGDITDDGHPQQYEKAYEALKPFKGRLFIVPGNHDFGGAGNFYTNERAIRFDEMLSVPLEQSGTFYHDNHPVVNFVEDDNDQAMLIGLDSNLETDSVFDFACGAIGKTQCKALANLLTDTSITNMKKIVFFHHHPFMQNDPFMEMKDAKKLAKVIYGKVDVIMFGHKHEMSSRPGIWGAQYVLASDNSPGKSKAGEITIENGKITFDYVAI